MPTTRRDFLAAGAFAAFVPAVAAGAQAAGASPSPGPPASPGDVIPPLAFDLAAFDAATAKPAAHRHMFASTRLDGGNVLSAVKNTLDAYALLKEPGPVNSAVVLYHGSAIGLAFDDAVWKEFLVASIPKLPEHVRADLADYKTARGNPFLKATKPDEASVEGLAKAGTLFFVCKNATEGFAYLLATISKRSPRSVYDRLVAGLLPGAALVPAGVWAVHALQERHYTYLQATL